MAFCVRCGLEACAGCDGPDSGDLAPLPWEDSPRHWLRRLWQTALSSSVEPQRTFGELPQGTVGSALAFAVLAETFALGSLGGLAAITLRLVAPRLAQQLLGTPAAVAALAALLVGSVVLMVCLHTLWGVCLELGASRGTHAGSWRQGSRFGLYACGWDLVTSPFGLACALISRGPLQGWAALAAAARAPRLAQRAYLETCRGYGGAARQQALRLSIAVLGTAMLLLVLGLTAVIVVVARRFGY